MSEQEKEANAPRIVTVEPQRAVGRMLALEMLHQLRRAELLAIEELPQSPCPQACGQPWPACGCPTAEQKSFIAARYEPGHRRRRGPKGLLAMMVNLGAKEPDPPASPLELDYPDRPDLCIPCRIRLFGGARGQMTAERCSACRLFICGNCDAEHDGVDWHPNHTGDVLCVHYGDDK